MTDSLQLLAVGTNISAPSGSSSSATAIPVAADGVKARYIRVATTGNIYFAIGTSAISATSGHPIISVSDSQIIAVGGHTHVAVYGIGAITPVTITPLENQR